MCSPPCGFECDKFVVEHTNCLNTDLYQPLSSGSFVEFKSLSKSDYINSEERVTRSVQETESITMTKQKVDLEQHALENFLLTDEAQGKMEQDALVAKKASPLPVSGANRTDRGPVTTSELSRIVDLRSDTVTQPTALMRAAMAEALVDDDILGADPTAAKLQESMAKVFGKEAGLFVPSGTMGNLIAVLVHCEVRGSEVILGSESHVHYYEQGGISTLGGVYSHVVPNEPDGTMDLGKVEAAIRPDDDHFASTRLICIENTHNRCGGRCISAEYTDKIGALAKCYKLKFHVDGARIFNAAAALGVSVERLCRAADSVSICLSKGLGAPVGSVLVGSHEFIAKAKRLRKALGGGMRQIGVLCGPGLVALNYMVQRLGCDHRNARLLAVFKFRLDLPAAAAKEMVVPGIEGNNVVGQRLVNNALEGLNTIGGLSVDVNSVETNIVFIEVTSESPLGVEEICEALKEQGILAITMDHTRIRLVTHHQVTEDDTRRALSCFKEILVKASSKEAV